MLSIGLACMDAGARTTNTSAPVPARHGTLRLALTADPRTLDPTLYDSQLDFLLFPLLYQPLVDLVDGNHVVNNLTTNWTFSPDRRVLTFQLLPGVRFSNGREATAEDYAFALDRAVLAPAFFRQYACEVKGASNRIAGSAKSLAGLSTPTRYTLVVELDQPDVTFPYWMVQGFGIALARETLPDPLKDVGRHPVGTGPYVVKEWVRGARLRFERNPYYFRPEQQYFDAIEIVIGADESAQTMMFERGELDVANIDPAGVCEADFPRLRKDPRWRPHWLQAPLFNIANLGLNVEMPPLDDVRVRRAIACAINRKHFMQLNGERVAPGHGAITPAMAGYNPSLKCPPYDPNRARALLRQAGFTAGLPKPLKLWYPNTQIYRRWAQAIQADLAEVGVRIEPNGLTRAAFGEEISRRRTAELTLYGNNANVPDPSTFLIFFHSRFITEEDSQNNSFYSSPKVDELLDRAAVCIDEPHRLELYQQAEKMILDDVPMIVLGQQNLFALRQPWLKGPLLEPFWWFRFDRVWLER